MPVLVDGGIRDGADVLRALALGADAVLIGRPYAWGLACDGEAGVRAVLDALHADLRCAMALAGCPSLDAIDDDARPARGLVRVFARKVREVRVQGGRNLHVRNLFRTCLRKRSAFADHADRKTVKERKTPLATP